MGLQIASRQRLSSGRQNCFKMTPFTYRYMCVSLVTRKCNKLCRPPLPLHRILPHNIWLNIMASCSAGALIGWVRRYDEYSLSDWTKWWNQGEPVFTFPTSVIITFSFVGPQDIYSELRRIRLTCPPKKRLSDFTSALLGDVALDLGMLSIHSLDDFFQEAANDHYLLPNTITLYEWQCFVDSFYRAGDQMVW